ncbi:MAG: acyl-CoA--6-aminopenicillanic acid acyltransferase [Rhodobacteraceae bacterium]|nr:acyl-CoA--6-aminopenicillanic acid acyltransferase [Paracoccaceae bacterium]
MKQFDNFPLIEISGPPMERGFQYGEQAKEKINFSIELYSKSLRDLGLKKDEILNLAKDFLPSIKDWAPDLIDEMRGIAKGASVKLEEIILINARTEILQLAERKSNFEDTYSDGCTGAFIMPKLSETGEVIHGQNWDWKEECIDNSIVVRILRDNGPDVLTFTEAGGVARSGLNSNGISITANYLKCDRDYANLGIPLPFIRRKALECRHYSDAIRIVAITQKSGANNMILGSSEGMGINFECAPDESFAILPDDDGLIVHANHWQHIAALSKLKDTGISWSPDSFYRDYKVREKLLAKKKTLTVDDLKEAFYDDFGAPFSVCIPPYQNTETDPGATVAMIIMQPSSGIMEISPFPAINKRSEKYYLDMTEK